MELDSTQLGSISSFAVRTAHFAECVAEAHQLGYGPGRHTRPWSLDFQRQAAPIYAETFPAAYRRGLADASRLIATYMDCVEISEPTAAEWGIVAQFLRAMSKALAEASDVVSVAPQAGRASIGGPLPAVLRYELFAELLNSRGVTRLRDAANATKEYCQTHLQYVPTAQEIEWIISIANRIPVEELAKYNNLSTRSMYNRLESMWKHLGVSSQVQGVALAVQKGWIAPPPACFHKSSDQKSEGA